MKQIIKYLTLIFFWTPAGISGQQADPYAILDSVKLHLESVYDYSAEMEINVYVDFISIPTKHATVFYKKPDKIRFKSDEFFLLPRNGMGFSMQKMLNREYSALYAGQDTLDRRICHLVRIIPEAPESEVVLATLWIDTRHFDVHRSEVNTRNRGSYTVEFDYNRNTRPLPVRVTVWFEVGKMKLPMKFLGNMEHSERQGNGEAVSDTGRVIIRFKDYRINRGMDDGFFSGEETIDY